MVRTTQSKSQKMKVMHVFSCELCEFNTLHESGLKIHFGKCHKNQCPGCGRSFKTRESLDKHRFAEMILRHSEPLESPDKSRKIKMNENGDPCLEVFDSDLRKPLAILHVDDCQEKCTDISASPILHTALNSVVLGELSEPGCFVDWSSFSALLEQHRLEKLT